MSQPERSRTPHSGVEWAVWTWAVGGVVLILLQAVVRLAPRAAEVFSGELTALQLLLAAVWTAFMLYSEAWRGFHLNFSPRVVARAGALLGESRPWLIVAAPLVAMGLVHATPRRLLVSRLLTGGIVLLVVLVRGLPDPWRGIVDLGVVVGLAAGVASIAWHAGRALLGEGPAVDPEFPSAEPA